MTYLYNNLLHSATVAQFLLLKKMTFLHYYYHLATGTDLVQRLFSNSILISLNQLDFISYIIVSCFYLISYEELNHSKPSVSELIGYLMHDCFFWLGYWCTEYTPMIIQTSRISTFCRHFVLPTFRFVDVLGLSTFWLTTFWSVDVSVCRRFD